MDVRLAAVPVVMRMAVSVTMSVTMMAMPMLMLMVVVMFMLIMVVVLRLLGSEDLAVAGCSCCMLGLKLLQGGRHQCTEIPQHCHIILKQSHPVHAM
jgi:hypothetical protein